MNRLANYALEAVKPISAFIRDLISLACTLEIQQESNTSDVI